MKNDALSTTTTTDEPLFLGDDLALDFVNTAYGQGHAAKECLQSDADVLAWLSRASLPADGSGLKPGALLRAALELREAARGLIEKRKAGAHGNPERLNRLLESGSGYSELVWRRNGVVELVAHERARGADGLLLPVAKALAALLSEGDFELVRKCEAHDCTLWFVDRTKAHSRRWCSAALCGNRAKVAAFRARKGARQAEAC